MRRATCLAALLALAACSPDPGPPGPDGGSEGGSAPFDACAEKCKRDPYHEDECLSSCRKSMSVDLLEVTFGEAC